MDKPGDSVSWLSRLKQLIQSEPQNEEELVSLLRDANIRSLIDVDTLTMLEGVISFSKMRARDIMLPKQQIVFINQTDGIEKAIETVTESGHSRFPVVADDLNEIVGILHAKDLLRFKQNTDEEFNLSDICRQAMFVPESKRLDSLLHELRSNKNHMAIVVDEYGAIAGFITLEDIIEQIIGDIEDEFDIDEDAYIKKHEHNHFIIKAHMPIEEFNEQLTANLTAENYDTIGGIIMNQFGYLPKQGEMININGFAFKIINADSRRIKLLECIDTRNLEITEERNEQSNTDNR